MRRSINSYISGGFDMRCRLLLYIFLLFLSSAFLTACQSVQDRENNPSSSEPVTLTCFAPEDSVLSSLGLSYEDTDVIKELENRLNIRLVFQTAPAEESSAAFLLLIASDSLPDLICCQGLSYSYEGGLDAAIEDGYYLDLAPYLETELADYNHLREQSDFCSRATITDAGRIGAVYQIFEEPQGPWMGLQIRQDWLEDLMLDTPVTYDDWELVLTLFRDEKGCYAPLSLGCSGYSVGSHSLSAGFHTAFGFLTIDGQVTYGPATENWKDYLTLMHDWYEKGLINPDFMTSPAIGPDSSMLINGQTGAWDSYYTSISWYESLCGADASVIPVTSPVQNHGDELYIRLSDTQVGTYTSVSSDTAHLPECLTLLNYLATREGSILCNYGIEGRGLTYNTARQPVFSAMVTQNPDGLASLPASRIYAMSPGIFPGSYDWKRELNFIPEKDQAAYQIWGQAEDDYMLPSVLSYTLEESLECSALLTDITSIAQNYSLHFIIGTRDLTSDWDDYLDLLQEKGLAKTIELTQRAYNRFYAR